jgi:hypothetical protein
VRFQGEAPQRRGRLGAAVRFGGTWKRKMTHGMAEWSDPSLSSKSTIRFISCNTLPLHAMLAR